MLTEARVAEYFLPFRPTEVRRYELPGVGAYNFLLFNVLGGGASRSLRTDSQGKTLALALLEMPIPAADACGTRSHATIRNQEPNEASLR